MASLGQKFDSNAVPPSSFDGDPIPAGNYRGFMTNSEMRSTKAGDGQYLWCEFVIDEGEYANRKVFDRINLNNANQTTVDIAKRTLSAICRAVNVPEPDDSEQLHGKPLMLKVRIRPAREGYPADNEIKGYGPIGGTKQAPQRVTPKAGGSAPLAPKATSASKPWEVPTPIVDDEIPF